VDRLDGIVISHEHSDHIGGLAQVLGQWRTTVYLTAATCSEVKRVLPESSQKRLNQVQHIRAGHRFNVGDIEVSPFSIPHDAVDPLAFTFRANGTKVAIVTDLGYLPELVKYHLRESDCLMLESNHDLEMLKVGPYPWHVKQRVMSRTGHLSNHTVSEFLADAEGFDAHARYVVLAASFREQQQSRRGPHLGRRSAWPASRRRGFLGRTYRGLARHPAPHSRFISQTFISGDGMSDQLTLIVRVKAKPGQEARLLRELKGMLAPTRAEAGCINYELHQSQSDPALFALYENWVSQAALDAHFETPYLKAVFKASSGTCGRSPRNYKMDDREIGNE